MRRSTLLGFAGLAVAAAAAEPVRAEGRVVSVHAYPFEVRSSDGHPIEMANFAVVVRNDDPAARARFVVRCELFRGETRRLRASSAPQDLGPGDSALVELAGGFLLGADRAECVTDGGAR